MREAGDIEQDANIVLGLWNKARGADDSPGQNAHEGAAVRPVVSGQNLEELHFILRFPSWVEVCGEVFSCMQEPWFRYQKPSLRELWALA